MTVEDIASAILQLPPAELDRFRLRFEMFEAERFDDRIEEDVEAGNLARIAHEALAEHGAGRTREL